MSEQPNLPESLLKRHEAALERAAEAEKLHGNVVDRLQAFLDEVITDPELWEQIISEPYDYNGTSVDVPITSEAAYHQSMIADD